MLRTISAWRFSQNSIFPLFYPKWWVVLIRHGALLPATRVWTALISQILARLGVAGIYAPWYYVFLLLFFLLNFYTNTNFFLLIFLFRFSGVRLWFVFIFWILLANILCNFFCHFQFLIWNSPSFFVVSVINLWILWN